MSEIRSFANDRRMMKEVFRLAIPIAFQNLLISCATIVDAAMVIDLGNVATSAVGVAGRYAFLMNVMLFGVCSGSSALISQYWGAKQHDNIKKSYGVTLTCALLIATVFTVMLAVFPRFFMMLFTNKADVAAVGARYLRVYAFSALLSAYGQITCAALRATERVYVPLISSMAGVAVNVALNYILIYGKFGAPRLEVTGAAVASLVSVTVQSVIIFCFVKLGKSVISDKPAKLFSYSRDFVRKFLRISTPAFLNETAWALGTNVYIMVYARQGIENHSGYTVFDTASEITFAFFVGLCHACAILVGKRVGAGEHDKAYRIAKQFLILTPLLGVLVGIALAFLRDPLLSLLPIETEGARRVASSILLFFGFWNGVRNLPYTAIAGVFRAGGDTKTGMKLDLFGLYLCGIPTVLIFGLLVKVPFVLLVILAYLAEDTPKAVLCFIHFKSKKWIKQITVLPEKKAS